MKARSLLVKCIALSLAAGAASPLLASFHLMRINEVMIGVDEYPAVIKYALFRLGVIRSDEVRLPLPVLSPLRRRILDVIIEELSPVGG